MNIIAWEIYIRGVVQGVGFRPFVYRLAQEHGIKGWVNNTASGVTIWAEGPEEKIRYFYEYIVSQPPRLAIIVDRNWGPREPKGYSSFEIVASQGERDKKVLISPDVATCSECLAEIEDPSERRYGYPFANCTNCGPRFTIIKDVPYDRCNTTMKDFVLCPQCREEYENPLDRRFHAQPIACPVCGPKTRLLDRQGREFSGLGHEQLLQGHILAVKGLGGFHLVCNAMEREAVRKLRARKRREFKPFALMARDLATVAKYCYLSSEEEKLLTSLARPIVLLRQRQGVDLPPEVAPGMNTIGIMLPYTPLHHLLCNRELPLLVMTSANLSNQPLIIDNNQAFEKLAEVADFFLIHDRPIENRCDDSIGVVMAGRPQLVRRARGYVPLPIPMDRELYPLLACGGELKNTFCLTKGQEAYLSQHLGDLQNFDNFELFKAAIPNFARVVDAHPQGVAYDLHPDYMATRYGKSFSWEPKIGIQHHHAHMASCMAEHGLEGPVLGAICDGTGYGIDGAIWGFEILVGDYQGFERLAHPVSVPLPGGDRAAVHPERMAFSYLYTFLGEKGLQAADRYLTLGSDERNILRQQIDKGINAPLTSSAGRLFDGVSALLGVCRRVNYEGQAAMELEAITFAGETEPYPFQWIPGEPAMINLGPFWQALLADMDRGTEAGIIAARFHRTVAAMVLKGVLWGRDKKGVNRVVLSGGVFQNRILVEQALDLLLKAGFEVYCHCLVPANDGGLSLGQAIIASEVIKKCV